MENMPEQKNLSHNSGKDSTRSLSIDLPEDKGIFILSIISIVSMMCCCPCSPLGYLSLYYVFKTGKHERNGEFEQAKQSSFYAKLWAIINIALMVLGGMAYLVLSVAAEMM